MKLLLLFAAFIQFTFSAFSDDRDKVLGVWLIANKEAKVELYKNTKGQLEGRVVWLLDKYDDNGKLRKDIENDDESLRNRPIIGMTLAYGFEWNAEKQQWENGSVYVPGNGNTYCGAIKYKEDGTLYLRGYVCGIKFLGKTSYCTRSFVDKNTSLVD